MKFKTLAALELLQKRQAIVVASIALALIAMTGAAHAERGPNYDPNWSYHDPNSISKMTGLMIGLFVAFVCIVLFFRQEIEAFLLPATGVAREAFEQERIASEQERIASRPLVIVRTYRSIGAFERDAISLEKAGYAPTSQNWTPGQWGAGDFITALLLCFVLIGLIVFLYMLIVKPAGTLTVTYRLQAAGKAVA